MSTTASSAEGDIVSQAAHQQLRRPHKKSATDKPAQAQAHNSARTGDDELARQRRQLDELQHLLLDSITGMKAEIKFLRGKMPEADFGELDARLDHLTSSVSGAKGQLGLQLKMIQENKAQTDELKKLIEDTLSSMEDVRTQVDNLHLHSVKSRGSGRLFGGWSFGHLISGGAATGGYAAVGVAINAVTGKATVPINVTALAATFLAGLLAYEVVDHVP